MQSVDGFLVDTTDAILKYFFVSAVMSTLD
jgi:hypothetical protein